MGAALDFSRDRFGGPVTRVERTVAIGVNQVDVLLGNPDRLGVFITNTGTTVITLSGNTPIAAGAGILLTANGSTYSATVESDGDSVALPLFGIGSAAGGSVRVVEYIRSP